MIGWHSGVSRYRTGKKGRRKRLFPAEVTAYAKDQGNQRVL